MSVPVRRPRILVAEPFRYAPEARRILDTVAEVEAEAVDRSGLLARVGEVDALVVRLGHRVDREVLEAGSRLRAVVSATTGLDHIDLEAARERGVAVLSLRGETEFLRTVSATAEHTWALVLALLRRIPWAHAAACAEPWDRDRFRGRELDGRRLGLVGMGRVADKVAGYGRAFGMRVRAFDPFIEAWPADVERVDDLATLMATSDVVSVHVPLSDATRGLIGEDELAALPAGAVLVNTSRGAVVRADALVEALRSGRLAGAAVDVVTGEGEPGGPLSDPVVAYAREHDDVIVTPHIAGATAESMEKTEVFMARKLAAFLAGGS